MPEDREKHWENEDVEQNDDDVEAHRHLSATSDPEADDSDDVEAHRHLSATSDPEADDSDDVEAHRHLS